MKDAASGIEGRLVAAGLSDFEASRKTALFARAALALEILSDRRGAATNSFFVPGRIEVLGKHTDYVGGRGLLCAVERGFCVTASGRSDRRVRVVDAVDGQRADLALDQQLAPASGWSVYPSTVARRLSRDFSGELYGADIAFASDLPAAAGLSSSSALVVALFTALADVNKLDCRPEYLGNIRSPENLAQYLGCLENGLSYGTLSGDRGAGALTGSEDQTAILCCASGELAQYAFCPVRRERALPMPAGWTFVIASSGMVSEKTGSAREKYNRLSRAARAVLDLWNEASGEQQVSLLAAAAGVPGAPARIREILEGSSHPEFSAQVLLDRFDQFLQESVEIIPQATEALARRDSAALGNLVDRSQWAAERLLGNQIPETSGLARLARSLGAIAASAFGGGFGGSVWAIVSEDEETSFRSRWAQAYARDFPSSAGAARFFQTRPGPALLRLDP